MLEPPVINSRPRRFVFQGSHNKAEVWPQLKASRDTLEFGNISQIRLSYLVKGLIRCSCKSAIQVCTQITNMADQILDQVRDLAEGQIVSIQSIIQSYSRRSCSWIRCWFPLPRVGLWRSKIGRILDNSSIGNIRGKSFHLCLIIQNMLIDSNRPLPSLLASSNKISNWRLLSVCLERSSPLLLLCLHGPSTRSILLDGYL